MNRKSLKSLPVWSAISFKSAKLISVLKLMKFTKIIVTSSTLALSALAYGWAFGPWFGVGLTAMLLIHEMGHVIALRLKGYPTHLPVFIPFLGAAIFVPNFGDRETEAYIGYGGPLLGSIAAFLCMALWLITGSPILLLTAYLGVYLNLFNLVPIRPLDGGRITQLAGPKLKYAALALLIGYTLYIGEPALMLIWVFVLQEIKLPLWWRSAIASAIGLVMLTAFTLDYSRQPWFLDGIDLMVAAGFISIYISIDHARASHAKALRDLLAFRIDPSDEEYERERVERLNDDLRRATIGEDDLRPYPARKTRLTWLGIYLASAGVLGVTLAYLIDHLSMIQ
jgi:Zn-dependent protease